MFRLSGDWQRGTGENNNGLLHASIPKGRDLSVHSRVDLDGIADSRNGQPHAARDWECPLTSTRKCSPSAIPLIMLSSSSVSGVVLQF